RPSLSLAGVRIKSRLVFFRSVPSWSAASHLARSSIVEQTPANEITSYCQSRRQGVNCPLSKPSTRSKQLIPPLHYDAAFSLSQRQTVTSCARRHTGRIVPSLRNQEFSGRWEHGSHFAKWTSPFRDSSKASLIFNSFYQYANSQDT